MIHSYCYAFGTFLTVQCSQCQSLCEGLLLNFRVVEDHLKQEEYECILYGDSRPAGTHSWPYNVPQTSEVAALIPGAKDGDVGIWDVVLRRRGQVKIKIDEVMGTISTVHRSSDPLCYPLLFADGLDFQHFDINKKSSNSELMKQGGTEEELQLHQISEGPIPANESLDPEQFLTTKSREQRLLQWTSTCGISSISQVNTIFCSMQGYCSINTLLTNTQRLKQTVWRIWRRTNIFFALQTIIDLMHTSRTQ